MGERSAIDREEIEERLAEIQPESLRELFVDCVTGEISPNIALARLLLSSGRVEEVEELVAEAARLWGRPLDPNLRELARLLHDHREGCLQVAAMLREHPEPIYPARDETVDLYRRFFDKAVAESEEVSVAAYALGDPALLSEVTREIVDLLGRWKLLGPERAALEIGCGIGRIQAALAPHLAEVHGIDISPGMIEAARRRCAGLPNVHLATTPGRDLSQFPDERFDLVFAADSFPYIHQAGRAVVRSHFEEAARVLRPGGDFVIFQYSYRDDRTDDRHEFRVNAIGAGLTVAMAGARPFKLWDGTAFHARKPPR